jgi:hypothetical protein
VCLCFGDGTVESIGSVTSVTEACCVPFFAALPLSIFLALSLFPFLASTFSGETATFLNFSTFL